MHQDWRILVGHFKVKLSFRKPPFYSFCLCLDALDQILSPSQLTEAKINMEKKVIGTEACDVSVTSSRKRNLGKVDLVIAIFNLLICTSLKRIT